MEKYQNPTRTVQEELTRERKFWKQNQLWSLLLVVVVLFFLLGKGGPSVAPGAEELLLTMHDGSTAVVTYDSITQAELLEDTDYGSPAGGEDSRTGKSGTWEHPQWGSYTLCVYASCSRAVRITAADRCYVANLPSAEETAQLYQLIQERMPASR